MSLRQDIISHIKKDSFGKKMAIVSLVLWAVIAVVTLFLPINWGQKSVIQIFFPSFLALLNTYTIVRHATICTVRFLTQEKQSTPLIGKYILYAIVVILGFYLYILALFDSLIVFTLLVLYAVRSVRKEKRLTPSIEKVILFAIVVVLGSFLYSLAMIGFVAFAFSVPY